MMRNFAREQGIKYYYEVGRSGISHQLLSEQGLIHPGDVVFGADSHSTNVRRIRVLCNGRRQHGYGGGVGFRGKLAAYARVY